MKQSEVMLGQIWSYIGSNIAVDETIKLIAKNTQGSFEYKSLFGIEEIGHTAYEARSLLDDWALDPEAKGSKYWRCRL